jgi:hypothetical protein
MAERKSSGFVKFRVERLEAKKVKEWNEFVDISNEGTLFHRLDFLTYHGDRFRENEHHIVIYKGDAIYSVMPLAIFNDDGRRIAKSPYGGSYGGPVFRKPQNYQDSHEVISVILDYLISQQIDECILTFPISVCYRCYSETFRLVLMERSFRCKSRDISSAVCLDKMDPVSKEMTSRARAIDRKARKTREGGVETVWKASIKDFWQVMDKTFLKHGAKPTHTLNEFQWLHEHFPDRVYVDVAYLNGVPLAGVGYIVLNQRARTSFYLCQDPEKRHLQALNLLLHDGMKQAEREGFHWFDFGTSSVNMQGRPNIFQFKETFGAIGVFRETYVWQR